MISSQRVNTNNMYNLNNRISSYYNSNSLKNKKCFILGGGQSLAQLNFNLIQKYFTIGVNRSFEKFPTNILYCMDHDFYERITGPEKQMNAYTGEDIFSKFVNFSGLKVFLAVPIDNLKYAYNTTVVNRIYKDECKINVSNLDDGIYAGYNSGFGAIMLAIALGAMEINLLGFDMKITSKIHYHTGYKNQYIGDYLTNIQLWLRELNEWAPKFKELNISITNCVFDSLEETALTCFPIKKLSEVI